MTEAGEIAGQKCQCPVGERMLAILDRSFALVGCDGSGAIYGPTVVRSEMGSEFVFQNALSDRRSANIAKAHHEYPARFH